MRILGDSTGGDMPHAPLKDQLLGLFGPVFHTLAFNLLFPLVLVFFSCAGMNLSSRGCWVLYGLFSLGFAAVNWAEFSKLYDRDIFSGHEGLPAPIRGAIAVALPLIVFATVFYVASK